MNERNLDPSRAIVRRRRVHPQISETLVGRTSRGNMSPEVSTRLIHDKIFRDRSRARRKFQMAGWCRDPRRHWSLRASTSPDKPSRHRVSACSATASPKGGQFDRTRLCAHYFADEKLGARNLVRSNWPPLGEDRKSTRL